MRREIAQKKLKFNLNAWRLKACQDAPKKENSIVQLRKNCTLRVYIKWNYCLIRSFHQEYLATRKQEMCSHTDVDITQKSTS